MYPVYLITCHHPSYRTHAKGYVGCIITPGKTIQQRWAEHSWRRKEHVFYLQKAIQKHGKEWFSVQQIDAGNTPEEAKELEKSWIQRLGTLSPMGYNLTAGGDGFILSEESRLKKKRSMLGNTNCLGYKHSDETKKKMSASRVGKHNSLGYKHSAETKRKVSEAHKGLPVPSFRGHKHTEETKARMGDAIRKWWRARKTVTQIL